MLASAWKKVVNFIFVSLTVSKGFKGHMIMGHVIMALAFSTQAFVNLDEQQSDSVGVKLRNILIYWLDI